MAGFSLDSKFLALPGRMHRLLQTNVRVSQGGYSDPGEQGEAPGVLPSPTQDGRSGQPEPVPRLSSCSQESPCIPPGEEEPQGVGPVSSPLWRSCPSSHQPALMLLIL